MTNDNWKTLRVPPEAYDAAKEQKEQAGRTWGEQIVRSDDADDTESVDVDAIVDELKTEVSNASAAVEPDAKLDRIYEQLERIEAAASTAEERTGKIERQLEDMGGR